MKKKQVDFYFLITVFTLLALGLIMVMSASSESARNASYTGGDAYYFFKRQFLWAIISVVAMFIVSKIDYHFFVDKAVLLFGAVLILLVVVLLIGATANGGQRWLRIGPVQFQPSEFAKVGIILYLAKTVSKNKNIETFKRGLLPNLVVIIITAGLLVAQPHLSATILIICTSVIVLFVGGVNWKTLLGAGLLGAGMGTLVIFSFPHARKRIFSFLDPFADPLGDGYQIIQSLYAIGSGGLFGVGLGQSRQKFLYIPEPHNDFIFAIWCEEFGFVGALILISIFICLLYRGIKIAMNARDKEGALVATGIISLIALQVIMNIAVVTAAMPVTGIPLPFFSYGGTALLVTMSCMGIMLNISKQSSK